MAYTVRIVDLSSGSRAPTYERELPSTATAAQIQAITQAAELIAKAPTGAGALEDFNDEIANIKANLANVANAKGNDGTRAATSALLAVIAAELIDATNATAVKDLCDLIAAEADVSTVVTAINALT